MNKILTTLAVIVSLIGSVWAMESHYAKASDLQSKADAAAVASLQREILRDRKEEVEYEIFVLQSKEEKTELDEFRILKLNARLKELEKSLE